MSRSEKSGMENLKVTVTFVRNDDIPAFGAYVAPDDGTPLTEEALVILNIEAMFGCHAMNEGTFKEVFIETAMHEVGHALEQRLDLPFSEERVEGIVQTYMDRARAELRKEQDA